MMMLAMMASSSSSFLATSAPWPSSPSSALHSKSTSSHHLTNLSSVGWRLQRKQLANVVLQRNGFKVGANPVKRSSNSDIIMVDPLEAKRLAAKQMQEVKARERLKRRHLIEAINGAWAMIGLTAGLVVEGQTGKGILAQITGYASSIIHFFFR